MTQALQRLADSLQVLVLLLPAAEHGADARSVLIAAAAKQVLEDVETLREQLVSARRPVTEP